MKPATKGWAPKPTAKPAASLLNTTWKHNTPREAGPAIGIQLPNQFILKSLSKDYVGLWQVGSLTTDQTFWPKAQFKANFTQLNLA